MKTKDLLVKWKPWPGGYSWIGFLIADVMLIVISLYLAFLLRFEGAIPLRYQHMLRSVVPIALGLKLMSLFICRAYRFSWSYAGLEDLFNAVLACGIGSLALGAFLFLFHNTASFSGFPRSILVIDLALTVIGVIGIRLSKRLAALLLDDKPQAKVGKRTLVVGAGEAGEQLVRSLKRDKNAGFWPVGFVDDDSCKHGLIIHGVPVLGARARLPALIRLREVEAVIIAMPSAPSRVIRETVELVRNGGVKEIKIVPFLSELYTGEVKVSEVREVRPEDILPREPVSVDLKYVRQFLQGKKVLVTGAAGSIGSELCRQILRFAPGKLLALDFDETGLFWLERGLKQLFPEANVQVFLADIRESTRVASVFRAERPDVVFHAAAYKHVPILEFNPQEAVKTNIFGTRIMVEEARQAGVDVFVLISTDKAVNPVSVMGMTKRVAEMVALAVGDGSSTRCVAVRFGNVLGSRGSVVPIFLEQIRRGGPVTVTHPEMERYFMTPSEAVLLVLQAAAMGQGGEVFVLDMGKPVKILDIAKELIRFHGLKPDEDIPIVFTGMRPGEKLREELLTAEEGTEATRHRQIYVAKMSKKVTSDELMIALDDLAKEIYGEKADGDRIKVMLRRIIYGPASPASGLMGGIRAVND